MIWLWLALGVYALPGLITGRLIAGHLAWSWKASHWYSRELDGPNGEQWFGAILVGCLTAVIWPVMLVGLVPWRVGAERQAELDKRERKLREAERELGL